MVMNESWLLQLAVLTLNTRGFHGLAPEKAKTVLQNADAVAFDVDSTVCTEEGIDVLADFLGQGQAVADLTAK